MVGYQLAGYNEMKSLKAVDVYNIPTCCCIKYRDCAQVIGPIAKVNTVISLVYFIVSVAVLKPLDLA